jgi:TPR repeat protein
LERTSIGLFGVMKRERRNPARMGFYDFERCLEYRKVIARDRLRPAKSDHAAADLNHGAAQNGFGICLGRGIGVHPNLALAVEYSQRAAHNGHLDGANTVGFCLEHGRCVANPATKPNRFWAMRSARRWRSEI